MSDRYEIDLNVKPGDDLQDEEMAGMHSRTLATITIIVDISPLSVGSLFQQATKQHLQDYQDQL